MRINNCFAFNEPVEFNLNADLNDKSLVTNLSENKFNILKTVAIYGPNNTGKSSFINSIIFLKSVLQNKKSPVRKNIFNEEEIIELGVTFVYDDNQYSFDFKYHNENEEFVYECFKLHKEQSVEVIYIRDFLNKEYDCNSEKLKELLPYASRSNIVIYTVDSDTFDELTMAREVLKGIAEKIDIVKEDYKLENTLNVLKSENEDFKKQVVGLIKKADIYLEDVSYHENLKLEIASEIPGEMNTNKLRNLVEKLKLTSTYRGKQVPSMLFDSLGTKRFMSLASYIVDAINNNRILIIDELDSSLHSRLTRAIVSLFNNNVNQSGQLIFTTHDTTLLDITRLFRKDQIWFTHKDNERVYLYSLNQIVQQYGESVIDSPDNLVRLYEKGIFLAIANPDLLDVFLSRMSDDVKGD